MTAQAIGDPFRPQPPRGLGTGAALSLVVHGGLVAVLAALVWRSAPPQALVAELWSAVPQQAAPAPVEVVEEVLPPPKPAPKPEPSQQPPAPPPAPPAPSTAPREADIALQKARAEKAREEKEQQERVDRLRREKLEREKAEKAERDKAEKEKARREKAEREKVDREKAEREKVAREKAEREKAEKAAQQRAEKLRQENLARMQGLASGSGASTAEGAGAAAVSSGPSSGYAGRIRARIKPLIVYPDAGAGNPVAEVEVRLSPTGTILGSRLLRRSGTPEWDAAVLRAVEKAEVLPRDVDGRVPPVIVLVFSPKE